MGCSISRCRKIRSNNTGADKKKPLANQTLLPIDENVKIQLVPKFYISEGNAKERTFTMIISLTNNTENNSALDLSATVEFLMLTVLSKRPDEIFAVKSYGRSRDVKVHTIKASNVKVQLSNGISIRISGTFNQTLDCLGNNCKFDLILRRQTDGIKSKWLEGTLVTRTSEARYSRYWKAVARDYGSDESPSHNLNVPSIVVTGPYVNSVTF